MAPIRETTPSSETPRTESPVDASSPALPTEQALTEPPTRDVVGWTSQPELKNGRRLSVEVTRKVLATALGLRPEADRKSVV